MTLEEHNRAVVRFQKLAGQRIIAALRQSINQRLEGFIE